MYQSAIWMTLKHIMLGEYIQTQKSTFFYDSTSMRCPDKGRSRQKGDEWSPAATPVGKKVLTTKGRSFEENRNILKLD